MLKSLIIVFLLVACAESLRCYVYRIYSHDEVNDVTRTREAPPGMACVRYDRVRGNASDTTDHSEMLTAFDCACEDITSTCAHNAGYDPSVISCEAKCCNTDFCNGAKLSDIEAYPSQPDVTTESPDVSFHPPMKCYLGFTEHHDKVGDDDSSIYNVTTLNPFVCYRIDKVLNGSQGLHDEAHFGSIEKCVCENPQEFCAIHNIASNDTDVLSCEAKCCKTDFCNGAKLSDIGTSSTVPHLPAQSTSSENEIITTTKSPVTTSSVGAVFDKKTSFFVTLATTLTCLCCQYQ